MTGERISVGDTTPAVLVDAQHGPVRAVVRIPGALTDPAYLGGSGVTADDGIELPANGDWLPVTVSQGDKLYAICASTLSTTIHVLATG